jgi:ZIP family zinc transporter
MKEFFLQNLIYIIALFSAFNVFLGGLLVLKFKKYFNTILGFAGGIMISIISFEVLPEIIEISHELDNSIVVSSFFLFGILLFHIISHFFPMHEHGHHDEKHEHSHNMHHHKGLGIYGSILMIIHSFIDGLGIGLAFHISNTLGLSIAIAVLAHNFSDGVNTVSTLLHGKYKNTKIKFLFILNILAPIFGILTSKILENTFLNTEIFLLGYLSFFTGSILYLALSDILPHAHSDEKNKMPIFATFLAVVFIFCITFFIPHSH